MKRLIITLLVSNFLTLLCVAQPRTLEECMCYAVENSIAVGKQEIAVDNNKVNLNSNILKLLPSVSGNTGGSFSFGR